MIYVSNIGPQCKLKSIFAGQKNYRIHNFSKKQVSGKILNWIIQTAASNIHDTKLVMRKEACDWSFENVHTATVLFQSEIESVFGHPAANTIKGLDVPIANTAIPMVIKHYLALLSFSDFEIAVDLAPSQFHRVRPTWKKSEVQIIISKPLQVLFDIRNLYGGQVWQIMPNEITFKSKL